jgi:hypothetical protein
MGVKIKSNKTNLLYYNIRFFMYSISGVGLSSNTWHASVNMAVGEIWVGL